MTRAEHMQWCRQRALEYVDAGDIDLALVSMLSDLGKHDETQGHPGGQIMVGLRMMGQLNTAPEMRMFINGFN